MCTEKEDSTQSKRKSHRNAINLNYPPFYVTFDDKPASGEKKPDIDLNGLPAEDVPPEPRKPKKERRKRANVKEVAKISLDDLTKHFDRPMTEASELLNVGLTVLKRKCREFGIPRWPHRKIKSLGNLISNLQEEEEHQEEHDEAAAIAAAERRKMLETEKEVIEKKPDVQIKTETKRFRQGIFKKRHQDRAKSSKEEQKAESLVSETTM